MAFGWDFSQIKWHTFEKTYASQRRLTYGLHTDTTRVAASHWKYTVRYFKIFLFDQSKTYLFMVNNSLLLPNSVPLKLNDWGYYLFAEDVCNLSKVILILSKIDLYLAFIGLTIFSWNLNSCIYVFLQQTSLVGAWHETIMVTIQCHVIFLDYYGFLRDFSKKRNDCFEKTNICCTKYFWLKLTYGLHTDTSDTTAWHWKYKVRYRDFHSFF